MFDEPSAHVESFLQALGRERSRQLFDCAVGRRKRGATVQREARFSMNVDGSVKVFADTSKNELRISFVGVIKASDMPRYEVEILHALQTLRPGFALLTDLTDLSLMEMGCVPAVERTMDVLGRSEVRLVVRVIPGSIERYRNEHYGSLSLSGVV